MVTVHRCSCWLKCRGDILNPKQLGFIEMGFYEVYKQEVPNVLPCFMRNAEVAIVIRA